MKTRNVVLKIKTRQYFKGCICKIGYRDGLYDCRGYRDGLYDCRGMLFDCSKQFSSSTSANASWFLEINFFCFSKFLWLNEDTGKCLEHIINEKPRFNMYITKPRKEWE